MQQPSSRAQVERFVVVVVDDEAEAEDDDDGDERCSD